MGFSLKDPFRSERYRSGTSAMSVPVIEDNASLGSGKFEKDNHIVSLRGGEDAEATTAVDPTLNPGTLSHDEGEPLNNFMFA